MINKELIAQGKHFIWNEKFPLSNQFDPNWVLENQMGPNVLWLLEWLMEGMNIKPGMRILDLGCGKGLSSIFLAKELDVEVWATDLWIEASENWERISYAGLSDKIFPIHADARSLPYAKGFFDAVISIDSYHYFGTDQMYMGYLQKFLKPLGQIGIVLPGLHREFTDEVPAHLKSPQKTGESFWQWDCCTFHSACWWKSMMTKYPFFKLISSDSMSDGGEQWLKWERMLDSWDGEKLFPSDIEALEIDNNQNITFIRMIGHVTEDRDSQTIGEMIGDN